MDFGWGSHFDVQRLDEHLRKNPQTDLLLAVGMETSVGMINNIAILNQLAEQYSIKVVIDGVSSVGVQRDFFKLPAVAAVSTSSGKALAGLPGIAIVFLRHNSLPQIKPSRSPYSLDLNAIVNATKQTGSVRNTLSSLLLYVLAASCRTIAANEPDHYSQHLRKLKEKLVTGLAQSGIIPYSGSSSSIVITFYRPDSIRWTTFCRNLNHCGVGVYHVPSYLEKRRLFQIATMGDFQDTDINMLINTVNYSIKKTKKLQRRAHFRLRDERQQVGYLKRLIQQSLTSRVAHLRHRGVIGIRTDPEDYRRQQVFLVQFLQ